MQTRIPVSALCLLVLSLGSPFLGCGGDDQPATAVPSAPTGPIPPPDHAQKKAEAEEDAASKAGAPSRAAPAAPAAPSGGVALAAAGHHHAAVTELQAALAADASDDRLWRMLGREAAAAGQARAVYDALDAGAALGGRAAAHHLLRAELALAAGNAGAAVEAARFAAAEDAAGALGMLAMAAQAGARVTPDAGADAGAAALLSLGSAKGAAVGKLAAESAGAGGWRGAVVRARALQGAGMATEALAAWGDAAGDADPRGVVLGNLGRAGQALAGGDVAQAQAWARDAALAAAADGDAPSLLAAVDLAAAAGQRGGDPAAALATALEASEAITTLAGGSTPAEAGIAVSRAALLAGQPAQALAASQVAVLGLPEQAHPHADALRALATAVAFMAADSDAVDRIAGSATAGAAAGLAGLARGERGTMPALAGLSPVDAALVGLTAVEAHVEAGARADALQAAAKAAASAELPLLSLQAHLAWESAARAAGRPDEAAKARAAVAAAVGTASPQLQAELAARATLAGDAAEVPAEVGGAWRALALGEAPPAEADALQAGVAAWASARALAGQGKRADAAKGYLDALGGLPTHRFGRLSLGTALDGSTGVPVGWELNADSGLVGETGPVIVLAAHEVLHRVTDVDQQVAAGRDLFEGLSPAATANLADAVAAARVSVARWLMGGDAPDLAAFTEAEAAALAEPALARLAPQVGTPADSLANADTGDALLSFVSYAGRLYGAVLSSRGFATRDLGPADRILATVEAHGAALRNGSPAKATGNAVRAAVLDTFAEQISGVARYIVVGPVELRRFGVATVPEQADALRWLEDIRDVSSAATIASLVRPSREYRPYAPDLLALASPEAAPVSAEEGEAKADAGPAEGPKKAGGKKKDAKAGIEAFEELLPGEIERGPYPGAHTLDPVLAVAVSDFSKGRRQLLSGTMATVEAWNAGAADARVIQITDVPAGPGGGFVLADGVLDLGTIRGTAMQADYVYLSAEAPIDVQLLRAEAFLDAGVSQVVVMGWAVPEEAQVRFTDAMYEALNQERPLIRAVDQGRQAVRNDPLQAESFSRPNVWGSFMLVGRP